MNVRVTYSPRGPGHQPLDAVVFEALPSPREIAAAFGIKDGPHYERIIDGSYTVEVL